MAITWTECVIPPEFGELLPPQLLKLVSHPEVLIAGGSVAAMGRFMATKLSSCVDNVGDIDIFILGAGGLEVVERCLLGDPATRLIYQCEKISKRPAPGTCTLTNPTFSSVPIQVVFGAVGGETQDGVLGRFDFDVVMAGLKAGAEPGTYMLGTGPTTKAAWDSRVATVVNSDVLTLSRFLKMRRLGYVIKFADNKEAAVESLTGQPGALELCMDKDEALKIIREATKLQIRAIVDRVDAIKAKAVQVYRANFEDLVGPEEPKVDTCTWALRGEVENDLTFKSIFKTPGAAHTMNIHMDVDWNLAVVRGVYMCILRHRAGSVPLRCTSLYGEAANVNKMDLFKALQETQRSPIPGLDPVLVDRALTIMRNESKTGWATVGALSSSQNTTSNADTPVCVQ
jgi:hypothetical protein